MEQGNNVGYSYKHNLAWQLDARVMYPPKADDPDQGAIGFPTGPKPHGMIDTPDLPFQGTMNEAQINDEYRAFIMFRPPGADSRLVPLQSIHWAFKVRALKPAQQGWQLDQEYPTGEFFHPLLRTADVPQWEIVKPLGQAEYVQD